MRLLCHRVWNFSFFRMKLLCHGAWNFSFTQVVLIVSSFLQNHLLDAPSKSFYWTAIKAYRWEPLFQELYCNVWAPTKLLRRKLCKNAHFLPRITTFASDNSERSLAIQNDVLQSTPLISKSLPIRIATNGNLLFLSQIVRNQKMRRNVSVPAEEPFIGWRWWVVC